MYEDKTKTRINVDWKSLLIKMVILLGVVFIVLWVISLFKKEEDVKPQSNLMANLQTMQEAAFDYFKGSRLPETLNGKKKITLQEMFDTKLLIEFKDQNGNSCSTNESYAEATKISEDNYTIKVKLVCGKDADYVIDTVKIVQDTVIGDNDQDNNDVPNEDDNNNSSNNGTIADNKPNDNNSNNSNSGSNLNNNTGGNNKPVTTVGVSRVYLDYLKIYVNVGSSKTVKATVYPTNATNKNVVWSSSNSNIAKVSNGVITGVNPGTVTITASAGGKKSTVEVVVRSTNTGNNNSNNNNNNNSGTCNYGDMKYNGSYTVAYLFPGNCALSSNDYQVNQYSINANKLGKAEYEKLVSETSALKNKTGANIYVDAPSYKQVYNTSGKGVVGYQITFRVKQNNNYSTKVIYEYYLNSDGSRKVIIDNRGSLSNSNSGSSGNTVVNVNSITLNKREIVIKKGESVTITATVSPSNATNKNVTWSSKYPNNVSVKNGVVTGKNVGMSTITASVGQVSVSTNVYVIEDDYINLSASSRTMNVGETFKIGVNANVSVSYRSANTNIATVDRNGIITAQNSGTTTIYVSGGNIEKRFTVVVNKEADFPFTTMYTNTSGGRKIDFNVVDPKVRVGSSIRLFAAANYFSPLLNWTSNNTSVATVDQNGNVRGISTGRAMICATDNRGVASSCIIVQVGNYTNSVINRTTIHLVTNGNKKVDFYEANPTLKVRTAYPLTAISNYLNPEYTWISTNTNIAEVDQNGNILARSAGVTTIIVIDSKNGVESSIVLLVTP